MWQIVAGRIQADSPCDAARRYQSRNFDIILPSSVDHSPLETRRLSQRRAARQPSEPFLIRLFVNPRPRRGPSEWDQVLAAIITGYELKTQGWRPQVNRLGQIKRRYTRPRKAR
jgi:hypothetical protein